MTAEELDRLESLADAATPGPWRTDTDDEGAKAMVVATNSAYPEEQMVISEILEPDDAAFIAASREALPRLVAEVRALRERIKNLEADVSIRDGALDDQVRRTEAAEARVAALERVAEATVWKMKCPHGVDTTITCPECIERMLAQVAAPVESASCPECGGSGVAHCFACNDVGVTGSGGDCMECVKPKPCSVCDGTGAALDAAKEGK